MESEAHLIFSDKYVLSMILEYLWPYTIGRYGGYGEDETGFALVVREFMEMWWRKGIPRCLSKILGEGGTRGSHI